MIKRKIFPVLIYFFFLLCLLPAAIFFYKHPAYNWDMLGYMAIVVRMDGVKDIKTIHSVTYNSAKENIPPQDYNKLVDSPSVRIRFANDPYYFEKILPIHVVKPLYTWSAYLFYKAGFTLPLATVMPSIISYLVIGLLLFHWLKKYFQTTIAFVAALLVMYSGFMGAIAKGSSPDTLSAFFLFAAFYFILEKPVLWMIFLFLWVSLLTRVDNLINCFFILSLMTFSDKWYRKISLRGYFLMIGILLTSYILVIIPVRQFGWSLFYYSEYVKHMNFNRDFNLPFSFSDYISYAYSKAVTGFVNSNFTVFVFLAILIMVDRFSIKFRNFTFDQILALLFVFIIFVRFILLPDLSDRFYISFYLVIMILLVRKFQNGHQGNKSSLWLNN